MKLSESLLGAILVGVSLGTTVGCVDGESANAAPNEKNPEAVTAPDSSTTPEVLAAPVVQEPGIAVAPNPPLPVPKWAEDGCPGCGQG